MNEDTLKGKAKDIAGRVQRQAGEWTGSEEDQLKGSLKQGEGKLQDALGKAKDAGRDAMNRMNRPKSERTDDVEKDESEAA